MRTALASAADRRYGWWLLNLLGSIHANARGSFDVIVVHDLGLSALQRRLAASIRGVELRTVPAFVPHWREAFTWKPWIWTNLDAETIVYLDAGVSVLRGVDAILGDIDDRGYFVVSQGRPLAEIVPTDYYELYGMPEEWSARTYVAAGIVGFRTDGAFFRDVVLPTYEDCLRGRNVGFSPHEARMFNFGLNYADAPVLRDAPKFRWDQTIFNIHLFKALADPVVADLDKYGGFRSPRDAPDQVIWNHRRRGDFRYLARVPYRMPLALFGIPFGLAFRARWWVKVHSWLFRPTTYLGKARRLLATLRRT